MEEIQFKSDCQEVNDEDDYSDMTLRPLDPAADIDDFMVWATDEIVTKYCSWEPFTSKEDAMKHVINNIVPHPWYRAICLKNRPIGAVSVTKNGGNNSCRGELGYVLALKYWGKGIMTRAVKMAAGDIFMEWPHLKRLEAVVEVNNKGSLRVLEKAGFEREGVLRKYCLLQGEPVDMVMFSILSPDFPK